MKFLAALGLVTLLGLSAPAGAQILMYGGVPCTKDCSGHEAGYNWAKAKNITDPKQCGGNSNSFNEGCRVWAELQMLSKDLEESKKENQEPSAPQ